MSNLVKHAERELKAAGLFDEDSDYGGMIGTETMKVVRTFASADHSGMSAALSRHILSLLLDFKPLSPLTNNPDEWVEIPAMGLEIMHQSKRSCDCFSDDGLKTFYSVDDQTLSRKPLAPRND